MEVYCAYASGFFCLDIECHDVAVVGVFKNVEFRDFWHCIVLFSGGKGACAMVHCVILFECCISDGVVAMVLVQLTVVEGSASCIKECTLDALRDALLLRGVGEIGGLSCVVPGVCFDCGGREILKCVISA